MIQCRPKNLDLYISIFDEFTKEILDHFTADDLINLFKHNFFRFKMFEIGLISYGSILKQSQIDKNVLVYFFPEISTHDKRYYHHRLASSYHLQQEIMAIPRDLHITSRQVCYYSNDCLMKAILDDDLSLLIDIILKNNVNLVDFKFKKSRYELSEFINENEPSLIETAAFYGSVEIFKYLLMQEVPLSQKLPSFTISGGNTELFGIIEDLFDLYNISFFDNIEAAIRYHRNDIFEYLRSNSLFNNEYTNSNESAVFSDSNELILHSFIKSIEYYNISIFLELLPQMSSLLNHTNQLGQTPVHIAIECSSIYFLEFILNEYKNEININVKDQWYETPLMRAVYYGNIKMVEILCNFYGIDVNCVDDYGWTPLLKACYFGHFDIVKLLCKQPNININCKKNDNETPLHVAANNGYYNIVTFLCSLDGILINEENNDKRTPKKLALMQRRKEIAEFLSQFDN